MKPSKILIPVLILVLSSSAFGIEKRAFQMREDFGTEPFSDCYLNYYYYIPCPTYSWFWGFHGWECGDIIGAWFRVGDITMSKDGCPADCDPCNCHTLERFRVLDFAGYGSIYPGLFTVEFKIYCADQYGCPVGSPLWISGAKELFFGWNYIDAPLCLTPCVVQSGPPPCDPRFVITAAHTGTDCAYPEWGFDNISTPIEQGCPMHDISCCPALYPRPWSSHYETIHSGYYGNVDPTQYCPPLWFPDAGDTSQNHDIYGYLELAWRIYLFEDGPTATESSTWGAIKSMYK